MRTGVPIPGRSVPVPGPGTGGTGVYLLAAEQLFKKWRGERQRHLVAIAGEPLIKRTLRQLEALGHDAKVVTAIPELRAALSSEQVLVPENSERWLDTFLSTRVSWGEYDEIAILMGDVVWSDEKLKWMMDHDGSPMFFGAPVGVFHSITFVRRDFGLMLEKASAVTRQLRTGACYLAQFCPGLRDPGPERGKCPHYVRLRGDHITTDIDRYPGYLKYVANRKWAQSMKLDTVVVIMASGVSPAWKHVEFPNKLLLPIGKESLIERVVRQVKKITGNEPVVLTHWPEIQEVVPLYFEPEKYHAYTETFLSAREVWKDAERVIVLNGDMLWHPKVLKFVLTHRGSPAIYGDLTGNGFAWAFNEVHARRVVRAAVETMKHRTQVYFFRKLWGVGTLRNSKDYVRVEPPKTYTKDFDIAKDYKPEAIRRRLEKEG